VVCDVAHVHYKLDALTGLQDRAEFAIQAQELLETGFDLQGQLAVHMSVVNLGVYNDRKGHAAGDAVLRMVANFLREVLPEKQIGRFAFGSFCAIASEGQLGAIVERVNGSLLVQDELEGISFKAGYCSLVSSMSLDEAFKRARYAFEIIQSIPGVWLRYFDDGLERAFRRRQYVVDHLIDAIRRHEIRAYAQPIVRVLTGKTCEVEILARWESEEYGFLWPDEFIPQLEEHMLIHRLDSEVIRLACKQWREAADLGFNVPFGINLSRLDFELCDIFTVVNDHMKTYGVPIEQLHIEVTESALASNDDLLMAEIDRFRQAGFKLYLDDYGSGYSSLRVLEDVKFDVVKLDKSLLDEVEDNERARAIVADTVSMVKRLSTESLCEGVESEDQFLFLKAIGCQKAQGYYFSRPLCHADIMERLSRESEAHERADETHYYDTIGRVNLIDGTRANVQGVEAANFLGTQAFALVEVRDGSRIRFLSTNDAFVRFTGTRLGAGIEEQIEGLSAEFYDLRSKLLYTASKARQTGQTQQLDFVLEGRMSAIRLTHLSGMRGRDAYLAEALSVSHYSKLRDFNDLEGSLTFIYTMFKRIDLLDEDSHAWRNIYLNVPRYSAQRIGGTPKDEIGAFCDTFIHPDHREGFRAFYDLDTIDARLEQSAMGYLSDAFLAVTDVDRYEMQVFTLIPITKGGSRRYLSCMRALDFELEAVVRQRVSRDDYVTDESLLTGLLDVTDRNIFWKDRERRFIGANRNFLEYYGFESLEDILGRSADDLDWGKRNPHYRDDDLRVLKGDHVRNAHGVTIAADGSPRSILTAKMPLTSSGRIVGLVGYFEDVGPA
jgi:EAL domain-containing protein (putative c-di-GMP-specific phosphodiesterase class I)/GGDEF domain-containing protein